MSDPGIKQRWDKVVSQVREAASAMGKNPGEINIIAVSKTHPADIMVEAVNSGIDCFGENYVQELISKYTDVVKSINKKVSWHFIGHLQTNKVKLIAPFIDMIHSVDTVRLAEEISKEAKKNGRTIEVLLQVNTSGEFSKSGCKPADVFNLFEQTRFIENIKVSGLMTIGSFSGVEEIIRKEFAMLRNLKVEIDTRYSAGLKHLSMGMTGDYLVAIEEGATLLRIGTAIFGERDYSV